VPAPVAVPFLATAATVRSLSTVPNIACCFLAVGSTCVSWSVAMMPSAHPVYITIDPITEFEKHCVRYGMRFILIAYRGIVRLQTGAEIFDARREKRETALTDWLADDESYAAVCGC